MQNFILVTLNADLIEIEIPDDVFEEVMDDFRSALTDNEYWNIGYWTSVNTTYKGVRLKNINLKQVIGTKQ